MLLDEAFLEQLSRFASESECSVLQTPAGQFRSLECPESGTIVFEAMNGSYMPVSLENIF